MPMCVPCPASIDGKRWAFGTVSPVANLGGRKREYGNGGRGLGKKSKHLGETWKVLCNNNNNNYFAHLSYITSLSISIK